MRLCFFGTYTVGEGYPVNRVLLEGLRRDGHHVDVCREEAWGPFVHRALSPRHPLRALRLALRLLRAWWRLWRRARPQLAAAEWIVVGYPGFLDVHLARRLARGRRVALVSFISLYDTVVADRAHARPRSLVARLLRGLDRSAFRAADVVLVDTDAQGRHYAELFDLEPPRFVRSFVGEDDAQFAHDPAPPRHDGPLRVLFFGTYVPLHGIDAIVDAAQHLRADGDVHFTLVGSGQLYPELRARADRLELGIEFVPQWQSAPALRARIVDSHVCLGVFGATDKAARVIPYKVFDAAAVGRPVITRDSPAIRELFEDGRSALLCAAGDGAALAAAIRRVRDDDRLRLDLAASAHDIYLRHGSPRAVGGQLARSLAQRTAAGGNR